MKVKVLSIAAFLFFSMRAEAQIPTLDWAAGMGGTTSDVSRGVAVDAGGNVYTVGNFSNTADFDPSSGGSASITSLGGDDVFITKFSSGGSFIWAKSVGGSGTENGMAITLDASGNVYVAGSFENTVDFDPNAGSFPLSAVGSYDMFILKLDNAGDLVWAKSMGSANDEIPYAIELGPAGDVFTTGFFGGAIDFDPNAGTDMLTPVGSTDVFINHLDASGGYVWTKQLGGTDNETGNSMVIDATGNIYVTGQFGLTVDFDPGAGVASLTTVGGYDVFISKLDAFGNFVWAKSFGGTGSDYGYDVAIDATGNVYTTGRFDSGVDFDPGAGTTTLTSAGSRDVFISKLDGTGAFVWARQLGGPGIDVGNSINVDAAGNVYTTGYFNNMADFDPGAATYYFTSAGTDMFMSKLDATGTFVWAIQFGGTGGDVANFTVLDATGNIYNAGYFNGTADFDPSAGSSTLTSAGFGDAFVMKLNQSAATGIAQYSVNNRISVYPNPSNGSFTISHDAGVPVIRVMNVTGKIVYSVVPDANEVKTTISLQNAAKGIYFYVIETVNEKPASGKIIID